MKVLLQLFYFFISLTLFGKILSLDKEDIEDEDSIIITENNITDLEITNNTNTKIQLLTDGTKDSRLSLISLKNLSFHLKSNNSELNTTVEDGKFKLNSNLSENQIFYITSDKVNEIEIIHIINDNYSTYTEITEDNKKIKVKEYNFVKFIDNDDTKIKVEVKFNKEMNFSYGIVFLSSNDSSYIPRAFNFKDFYIVSDYQKKWSYTNKSLADIRETKKDKNYLAFIFSVKTNDTIDEYNVTINKDIMNTFLIVSIILALIFAVITFFLIRRKPNAEQKNQDDDFYNKDDKEETKEEGEKE